jgi:hypothetical protein
MCVLIIFMAWIGAHLGLAAPWYPRSDADEQRGGLTSACDMVEAGSGLTEILVIYIIRGPRLVVHTRKFGRWHAPRASSPAANGEAAHSRHPGCFRCYSCLI